MDAKLMAIYAERSINVAAENKLFVPVKIPFGESLLSFLKGY